MPSEPIILLVEDEILVRMIATEILEDAGAVVIEASTADVAWRILETRSDIDVLFTDIDMPGSMDGMALARRTRARWPHIGVLITSGRHWPAHTDIPESGQFLAKPYRSTEVVGAVRNAAARS